MLRGWRRLALCCTSHAGVVLAEAVAGALHLAVECTNIRSCEMLHFVESTMFFVEAACVACRVPPASVLQMQSHEYPDSGHGDLQLHDRLLSVSGSYPGDEHAGGVCVSSIEGMIHCLESVSSVALDRDSLKGGGALDGSRYPNAVTMELRDSVPMVNDGRV